MQRPISPLINATKIADGTVSNTEFQYISTLSSNAQDQIDAKDAATQAEMEAGTESEATAVPSNFRYHDAAAKFWCKWGNDGAIDLDYNILSISDAPSEWVLTIETDFSSADYAIAGMAKKTDNGSETGLVGLIVQCATGSQAAGSIVVRGAENSGAVDVFHALLIGFGRSA